MAVSADTVINVLEEGSAWHEDKLLKWEQLPKLCLSQGLLVPTKAVLGRMLAVKDIHC